MPSEQCLVKIEPEKIGKLKCLDCIFDVLFPTLVCRKTYELWKLKFSWGINLNRCLRRRKKSELTDAAYTKKYTLDLVYEMELVIEKVGHW